MPSIRLSAAASLLAASLMTMFVAGAHAAEAGDQAPPGVQGHEGHRFHGGPPDADADHGPAGFGPAGFGRRLHGLHLTEAQQDKVFALFHAEAPQRRERDKTIRKAHETLRELGHADRFDEARASAAARDLGQAIAAQALAQARLESQMQALLTPEQRERMRQHVALGDGR